MVNYCFVASNKFEPNDFNDIETFVDAFPDFQTILLGDEYELQLLLQQMGISECAPNPLSNSDFCQYWDLSSFKLPELNEDQFGRFYRKWIEISGRENNMDEYGNLIFLQGLSQKWNQFNYRFIVQEG